MLTLFQNLNPQVAPYGMLIIIGAVVGLLVIILRAKINGMERLDAFVAFIFACIGALLGGKLFYVIQGFGEFFGLNKIYGIGFFEYFAKAFTNAGLVFYGGLIGLILFLLLYCLIFKINFFKLTDTLLPSLPLAQGFGRIGCFIVGCCYGMPFQHGIIMSNSLIAPNNIPLFPIQLVESMATFVLSGIMIYYGRKPRKEGKLLSMYLIGYGVIRFILEFFRYDAVRGFVGALSVSQWISIIAIIAGIFLGFFYKRKFKNPI